METKIRILHIDDNIHDRKLIRDTLEKESGEFKIVEADSREKFEKHLSEGKFDLVLSDFNILGFDGLQVLQIVKEKYPDMPVIIVTGTGSEEIAIQAMKMGAAEYVIKSVKHIQSLAPTIKMVIDHKRDQEKFRLAEEALLASEMKFKTLTEAAPVGIFSTDADGVTNYVNPRWCEISGISAVEAMGNGWLKSVHADDRAHLSERWKHAAITKTSSRADYRFMHPDGTIAWVSGHAVPQKDQNGNVIGYIGTITDITERKQAENELIKAKEKAEESDKLKTAFLHNISHEIRTPMNAIIGFSTLLGQPDQDTESKSSFIKVITQSCNQLLTIVSDIIEISNIEAGLLKSTIAEVNLKKLLDKEYKRFSSVAAEKGLRFEYDPVIPDNLTNIITDKGKLVQILSNLLSNAFKFSSKGQIGFGCYLKGDQIEFHISDTGIGIPEEQHPKIFDRFYQVEHSASRQYEGTGLGLTIAKEYIELLGGKIWLTSKPGIGTTFYFTIPYIEVKKPTIIHHNILPVEKPLLPETKTILVAEDDDYNYFLIRELLSGLNIKIIHASNGAEAVDLCKPGSGIDLVLMDIKMPVMDGYTATRIILEQSPGMKIIAQTAYADDEAKAFEAGCIGFISKPFKSTQFIEKIKANF